MAVCSGLFLTLFSTNAAANSPFIKKVEKLQTENIELLGTETVKQKGTKQKEYKIAQYGYWPNWNNWSNWSNWSNY